MAAAICNSGTATLNDTISDNTASDGGGVLNDGHGDADGCHLVGNLANFGGGIGNHTTLTLDDDTIAGNTAANGGGGIANGGTATLNNTHRGQQQRR